MSGILLLTEYNVTSVNAVSRLLCLFQRIYFSIAYMQRLIALEPLKKEYSAKIDIFMRIYGYLSIISLIN